ncbi:hypothetical protein [Salinispora arenicola]|uniref:hypothetical protein n=1 Tax=Salinispora arenicola TaxID=168697 RepID=UPI0027DE1601|nr:hypothetical protein [Salinispora arenicola]
MRLHHAMPAAAIVLLLAACSSSPEPADTPASGPSTRTITGTMAIQGWPSGWEVGLDCHGGSLSQRGWDDLTPGAQVVVTDSGGKTAGVGTLELGKVRADPELGEPFKVCEMPFEVTNVPDGERFYGVEVGRRGKVQFDDAQLNTTIRLTIG